MCSTVAHTVQWSGDCLHVTVCLPLVVKSDARHILVSHKKTKTQNKGRLVIKTRVNERHVSLSLCRVSCFYLHYWLLNNLADVCV